MAVDDRAVAAIVGALTTAMHARAPDLYAQTAAQWLAVHLLAQSSPWQVHIAEQRNAGQISDRRLARVVEFIEHNAARPISLDELAAEAGISKFHFVRLFKRRMGGTPSAYLAERRLKAAERLLASTDLTVGQVAAQCGYPASRHFAAVIRRRYGCTLRTLREHVRAGRTLRPHGLADLPPGSDWWRGLLLSCSEVALTRGR